MSMITDSEERKNVPVYTGCLAYFPDAIAEVARLSKVGNDKHNPGMPLHWSRDKSSDHLDCVLRHALESGVVDEDGFLHDTKLAWRALANLQVKLEHLDRWHGIWTKEGCYNDEGQSELEALLQSRNEAQEAVQDYIDGYFPKHYGESA